MLSNTIMISSLVASRSLPLERIILYEKKIKLCKNSSWLSFQIIVCFAPKLCCSTYQNKKEIVTRWFVKLAKDIKAEKYIYFSFFHSLLR